MNAFLKIIISEIDPTGEVDIMKNDFMNQAMHIYTNRKNEMDTLARTFSNLNGNENFSKMNKGSKMSPRPIKKLSNGGFGNINGYSKLGSKSKDIGSRLKFSSLSMKTKGIIPANISNVNRSIHSRGVRLPSSHNESYSTTHNYKKSKNKG